MKWRTRSETCGKINENVNTRKTVRSRVISLPITSKAMSLQPAALGRVYIAKGSYYLLSRKEHHPWIILLI